MTFDTRATRRHSLRLKISSQKKAKGSEVYAPSGTGTRHALTQIASAHHPWDFGICLSPLSGRRIMTPLLPLWVSGREPWVEHSPTRGRAVR